MQIGPKLRTGLWKPPGAPRLGRATPRGLRGCFPFADPAYANITANRGVAPAARGATAPMGNTPFGAGLAALGNGSAFTVSYNADQLTSPLSWEVLFWSGASVTSQSIAGFNDFSNGQDATYDKCLGFNSSSQLLAYIFDGNQQYAIDTTTTFAVNTLYHAVMTVDSAGLKLYVNGSLKATTATGASYPLNPTYCCFGSVSQSGTSGQNCSATILLSNYANVPWTAAEVMGRARDPWGFLDYPDDDLFATLVGRGFVARLVRFGG